MVYKGFLRGGWILVMVIVASQLCAEQGGWDTLSRHAQASQPWWESSPEGSTLQQEITPPQWVPKREAHPWSSLYYAHPAQDAFSKTPSPAAEPPPQACKPSGWQQVFPCQNQ